MKLDQNDFVKRFLALTPREQCLSLVTGLGLVFYSLYLLIYEPIAMENRLLEQKINSQQQTLALLKEINSEVVALRENSRTNVQNNDTQSLMALIDTSSQQLEISKATKRMVPDGADKVTLWLENIDFDKLITWLAVLETKHAIKVQQIGISREQTKTGVVNAKLVLGA